MSRQTVTFFCTEYSLLWVTMYDLESYDYNPFRKKYAYKDASRLGMTESSQVWILFERLLKKIIVKWLFIEYTISVLETTSSYVLSLLSQKPQCPQFSVNSGGLKRHRVDIKLLSVKNDVDDRKCCVWNTMHKDSP